MPDLVKVRIPELPSYLSFGPPVLDDLLPIWLSVFNKTVHVDLGTIRSLVETGGGGTITPVTLEGLPYLHVVTPVQDGGDTVSLPPFAGKMFFLERDGQPLLTTEFEILSGGGFKLKIPGDKLQTGQRFKLTFYAPTGATPTEAASFISGTVSITTNATINPATEVNKLIQLRGGGSAITLTLPDISTVPANTLIPVEATINNTFQAKIQTQGGQFIYLNNTSKLAIHLGIGENVWFFAGSDGWYIINDFAKIYTEIGKPYASYGAEFNELICQGQTLSRTTYARLWEKVQTYGGSLVSDAVWNTPTGVTANGITVERPYRGCFSTGDGTTTFRLPDGMDMALRGIQSLTGTDNNRFLNKAGGYQGTETGPHDHLVYGQDNNASPIGGTSNEVANVGNPPPAPGSTWSRNTGTNNPGGESVMQNIGVLWVIKY